VFPYKTTVADIYTKFLVSLSSGSTINSFFLPVGLSTQYLGEHPFFFISIFSITGGVSDLCIRALVLDTGQVQYIDCV